MIDTELRIPESTKGKAEFIGMYLGTLGNDPEGIANTCTRLGAQGFPKCPRSCVVASLVERLFGINVVISQFGGRIMGLGNDGCFPISAVMAQFITDFDKGRYPQLVGEYRGDPFHGNTTK